MVDEDGLNRSTLYTESFWEDQEEGSPFFDFHGVSVQRPLSSTSAPFTIAIARRVRWQKPTIDTLFGFHARYDDEPETSIFYTLRPQRSRYRLRADAVSDSG